MQLPSSLRDAIEHHIQAFGLSQLTEAREELTKRYRQAPSHQPFMTTDAQRQAYVIYRLPATYAAIASTINAIQDIKSLSIKSVLDLGAGPGTAMWAICQQFPDIEKVTLLEKDQSLAQIGKQLARFSEHAAIRSAQWLEADLEQIKELTPHDLIILSYSVGELKPEAIKALMHLCWQSAQQVLIVIEPGTPVGFERIRSIRDQLISEKAHIIAPCPHQNVCPMTNGDWCHFSARVERSSLHRRLKGGSLGHEDEKFSYIAVTKHQIELPQSRVLRQPVRHSGHTILTLCTNKGVQQPTISKKQKELYKLARKVEWGDSFPFT